MPILDNSRHERFAQELAKGKSASEAYELAGFKPSRSAASRLSTNVNIQRRVEELQSRVVEAIVISREWVIERLVENANRAMQATEVKTGTGEPTGEYRYEGSVANKALELLGKELGMFVDRKEVGKPGDFTRASDDELERFIAERARGTSGSARREGDQAGTPETGGRGRPH